MIQRLNAHQFLCDTPVAAIYAAGVRVLKAQGFSNASIDVAQNIVEGSTRVPGYIHEETATIRVEIRAEGTLVSVFFVPNSASVSDQEASRSRADNASLQLESNLNSEFATDTPSVDFAPPISDPSPPNYSQYPQGGSTHYGAPSKPKRGVITLIFGLAGCLCPCTGPLAIYWGVLGIKESSQSRETDTGDMVLLSIGLILGGLQTLFLLAFCFEFVRQLMHPTSMPVPIPTSIPTSIPVSPGM